MGTTRCRAVAIVALLAGGTGVMSTARAEATAAAELQSPAWIVPVIDERFDASYQDMRTQKFVHSELARVIADNRYMPMGTLGTPDSTGAPAFCFAPGATPSPEVMQWVNTVMFGGFGERFFLGGSSWSANPNTPTTLSWSFVPDGLTITVQNQPVGISNLFAILDDQFSDQGGREVWIAQFQWAFDRWATLTGASYTRASANGVPWDDASAWGTAGNDTTRGDVRICGITIDGPSGILAVNQFPDTGSDMIVDTSERWDDNNPPTFLFLRSTVAHEHGHGLGLAHTCPAAGRFLMEPFATNAFEGPQEDDIRGAHFLYGDAFEPNNTVTTATNLGTIAPGGTITLGALPVDGEAVPFASLISLVDRQGVADLDFYRFNTDAPLLANIALSPSGTAYEAIEQGEGGGCPPAPYPIENSLATSDLRLQVLASNGTTVLLDRDQTPVGSNEVYSGLLLAPGTFFVAPRTDNGAFDTQMYNLSVIGQVLNMRSVASDGTVDGGVQIDWPSIPNARQYRLRRNTVNNLATATTTLSPGNPLALTFFDTTAVPLQQYFYWLEVRQFDPPMGQQPRFVATTNPTDGEPGLRPANNMAPVANAGLDVQVTDTVAGGFGFEAVTLDGTLSTDSDGTITAYAWRRNGLVILQQATGSVLLPLGLSTIQLTVTDNDFATSTDTVIVRVNPRTCDSIDFNNDGSFFDPLDVDAFLSVFSEGPCLPLGATCNDLDFNNDGGIFDPSDVDAFLSVYSEGPCN